MENVIKTILPPKCFLCKSNYGDICLTCLQKFLTVRYYYCLVCDRPSIKGETHGNCADESAPTSAFSAFEYTGGVRKCIKTAKYRQKVFAPLKKLAFEAAVIASKAGFMLADYNVVPIPLNKAKNRSRGFNQANIIAKEISGYFGLRQEESILVRTKETKSQYKQGRRARFENLKGAFVCRRNVGGTRFLLVDDICTTGATLLEASRALYKKGAKEVCCFTIAKKF